MPQPTRKENPICYRCRKNESDTRPLIACSYCGVYWHLECLIEPLSSIPKGEWTCPKHRGERSHLRRHRKRFLNGHFVKIVQEEDDMTFNEADALVQYGSVAYSLTNKEIEEDFLHYARKLRNSSAPQSCASSSATAANLKKLQEAAEEEDNDYFHNSNNNDTQLRKSMMKTDQWLDNLAAFQFGEVLHVDGLHMLLEAAHSIELQESEIISSSPMETDLELPRSSMLNLDSSEYGKFEIIEELIQMKGENKLLDMLSNRPK